MFFPISKLFWQFAEPLPLLVLLGLIGTLLGWTRFARFGRWLAAAALVLLAISIMTPFPALIMQPLEDRFPQAAADPPAPAGIIVLGGGIDPVRSAARGQMAMAGGAGMRMVAGFELARRYPETPLIFSGGSGDPTEQELPEAGAAHKLWTELGVPETQMIFEDKSRNTWENALFTRSIVHPKPGDRYLLVTSAWHMPRSVGIFRKLGFDVVPYPVDFRTFGKDRDFYIRLGPVERIEMLDTAVREWIGLVAYRLTDKTEALFPAP